ncbi:MAG: RluA family pseudouridine synthase [Paludibacteraceae bacterium]|nr:RluA family pseudouridine synthase [Paludibacteraceae bacterium]
MERVRAYMSEHPQSELHRAGKMFGVLVVEPQGGAETEPLSGSETESQGAQVGYIAAFSAMLDGSFVHDGFVPPVFNWSTPDGYFRREECAISEMNHLIAASADNAALRHERKQRSQALQRWLFAQFRMTNGLGEQRSVADIFADTAPILSKEDYYAHRREYDTASSPTLPPSGAGECCAPKLLQYAFTHGLRPVCMAEFWMGASPKDEVRREGMYYPACQGKCKPILTHMLQGINVAPNPLHTNGHLLSERVCIIYEDADMIVADKPAGMLSVPGKEDAYSLQEHLQARYGQPLYAVHRLDMDTSGLIVFAKTEQTAVTLQQQFLRREVQKIYLAVVEPLRDFSLGDQEGIISLPLLPNPLDRPRQMVDMQHGKKAVTHWQVSEAWSGKDGSRGWLLILHPHTGRTHQLRVHCAHSLGLGCPIIGDRLYGTACERLMLHAAELRLTHPRTGEALHFQSKPDWD